MVLVIRHLEFSNSVAPENREGKTILQLEMPIKQAEILGKDVEESRSFSYVLKQERKVELRSRTHKQVSACSQKNALMF